MAITKRLSAADARGTSQVLHHGVVALTLLSAGTSAFAAAIAFQHQDTSAMLEAVLACAAAIGAAWLGRAAFQSVRRLDAAEEEARLAERKFQSAFTSATFGMLLAGPDGRVLETNAALQAMLGYSEAELTALSISDLNRPADRGRAMSWLRRVASGETDTYGEDRWYLGKDGHEIPVALRASAVRDEGGALRCLLAIVEDVTEARRTQARLVAAERLAAIASVATGLCHHINNPLSCVQANLAFALEALREGGTDAAELEAALGDAHASARRVGNLMQDLRAFSGGFADGEGAVDVRDVVAEAVASTQPAEERRARVVVDLPERPPVPGPNNRLSRAIGSLLRRAAEAVPAGNPAGEIRVTGFCEGPLRVAIEIRDDGPALPPTEALHLCEPFYGSHGARGGAELGAVLGIVRAIGGDVRAESDPAYGNVVRVLLPIAVPAGTPGAEPRA